jgi:beta-mannosidase
VVDFAGKVRTSKTIAARLPGGTARLLWTEELSRIAPRPEEVFVSLVLEHDGERVVSDLFLTEPKRCSLSPARISISASAAGAGFRVRLTADAPAFHAALSADGIPGEFSDNFFCILPGEPRTVTFTPRGRVGIDRFRRALALRHLRQTYR